jgi:C4-dicarboxylate-specific signal transduction histidine kinase
MVPEKTYRRLPLRDMMTDAEKRSRDVAEHLHSTYEAGVTDLRDLSRPLRRKSHYPTLLALQNALQKVLAQTEEANELVAYLERQLNEIRDHAKRERLNRR